eukprot:comp21606_c0_seq1/m.47587 comp21606_c0_seq1/g.47587  ORF comp21606_c0_seq1/g.47587 comp21606_c0_seq1/m.47587 type:complete len:354 (+) comp21606_c0_seq1:896-1957(+)
MHHIDQKEPKELLRKLAQSILEQMIRVYKLRKRLPPIPLRIIHRIRKNLLAKNLTNNTKHNLLALDRCLLVLHVLDLAQHTHKLLVVDRVRLLALDRAPPRTKLIKPFKRIQLLRIKRRSRRLVAFGLAGRIRRIPRIIRFRRATPRTSRLAHPRTHHILKRQLAHQRLGRPAQQIPLRRIQMNQTLLPLSQKQHLLLLGLCELRTFVKVGLRRRILHQHILLAFFLPGSTRSSRHRHPVFNPVLVRPARHRLRLRTRTPARSAQRTLHPGPSPRRAPRRTAAHPGPRASRARTARCLRRRRLLVDINHNPIHGPRAVESIGHRRPPAADVDALRHHPRTHLLVRNRHVVRCA